jgi:hypothetical protein
MSPLRRPRRRLDLWQDKEVMLGFEESVEGIYQLFSISCLADHIITTPFLSPLKNPAPFSLPAHSAVTTALCPVNVLTHVSFSHT